MTAANTSQSNKAMRGTKRVCQACEVRFYDLAREQIVCPACGVLYTPVAQAPVESRRGAAGSGKTGWRQSFKRPSPVPIEPDPQVVAPSDSEEVEVEASGDDVPAADAVPEDDIVLEQEPDDGDVSGLVDVDIEEPKER
jgi:uncharacterized protein (TIGR02300 family)